MIGLNNPDWSQIVALTENLIVGLFLSLVVAWYYERFGQSLSNRSKLARLLPVLTLTTNLVISIIKSSVALSLGLVGALLVVRFRTAVKEPEELIFLFIAIAIGLGAGADELWLTATGILVILGYMTLDVLLKRKSQTNSLYLNVSVREGEQQQALFNQVNDRLQKHVRLLSFRRLDSCDDILQITYFVHCRDLQALGDLVDDLKRYFPILEISFIQQDQIIAIP